LGFLKKLGSFGSFYFVGDVVCGVGLGFFGRGHCAVDTNSKSHFF